MTRYRFAFTTPYRVAALPFGITPRTAWADLDDHELVVHYGPWRLRTLVSNIASAERTGGFTFVKTAGPPHLSFSDRGISFTTNGADAACVQLHRPVPGIDPTKRIKHPGVTLALEDVPGFLAHVERVADLGG